MPKAPSASSTARTDGCCTAATRSRSSSIVARTPRWPTCCGPASGMQVRRSRPSRSPSRARRAPGSAADRRPDGCPAYRRVGVGRHPTTGLATNSRTGTRPHGLLAERPGGVRPPAARPRTRRARSLAGPCSGVPPAAQRRDARPRRSAGARRVLHRGRGARAQRFDVHRPSDYRDPLGHRVGGDRGHRRAEGPAPWRRPIRGRRPAPPDRGSRQRRALGPRRDRARRADHGLRAPRLPRLRSAGGRAPRGRRGHGFDGGLARHRGQGRGRGSARAGGAQAGPRHQDQRGVLRGGRAPGCRPGAELFRRPSPWPAMRAGPRT